MAAGKSEDDVKVSSKKVSKKKTAKKKVTKKKSAAKKVVKKAASKKKTASKKSAVKKTATVKTVVISMQERYKMVSEAAYHLSEKQGFNPANDMDNWLKAEQQIEAYLKKQKILVV